MKFLCIRNFFTGNGSRTRWTKGRYYEGRMPNSLEQTHGIVFYIKSNDDAPRGGKLEYFLKKKDYLTYFKSIEDVREEKINKILDVGNSNDDLVSGNTESGI